MKNEYLYKLKILIRCMRKMKFPACEHTAHCSNAGICSELNGYKNDGVKSA